MPIYVPPPLDAAWKPILERAARRTADDRGLGVAVERLSRRYHGETVKLADVDERAARTLFWFPRDVVKIGLPVAELWHAGALPRRRLRVLDVGAGVGATSVGLLRTLADLRARDSRVPDIESLRAIDLDPAALAVAQDVVRAARREGLLDASADAFDTCAADLREPLPTHVREGRGFDLVVSSLTLVEVTRGLGDTAARAGDIASRVHRLWREACVADDGAMVIVEPASRDDARALHAAREPIVANGFTIFAPCTHAGPCPMLERERDWCHEDLPVDLPAWLTDVARAAGLRWQGATFSYLVVRRSGSVAHAVRDAIDDASRLVPVRVVAEPRHTKGRTDAVLCGPLAPGVTAARAIQLDRDARRAQAHHVMLDALARGDVAVLDRARLGSLADRTTLRVGIDAIAAVARGAPRETTSS